MQSDTVIQLTDNAAAIAIPKLKKGEYPKEVLLFKAGWTKTRKGKFYYDPKDEKQKELILANQKRDGRLFKGGLPITVAHLNNSPYAGQDDKSAKGWFNLDFRDTGIWAVNCWWNTKGKHYLSEREYRFISPSFYGKLLKDSEKIEEREILITEISDFSLTNDPAIFQGQDDFVPIAAENFKDRFIMKVDKNKTQETEQEDINAPEVDVELETDTPAAADEKEELQEPSMADVVSLLKEIMGMLKPAAEEPVEEMQEEEMTSELSSKVKEKLDSISEYADPAMAEDLTDEQKLILELKRVNENLNKQLINTQAQVKDLETKLAEINDTMDQKEKEATMAQLSNASESEKQFMLSLEKDALETYVKLQLEKTEQTQQKERVDEVLNKESIKAPATTSGNPFALTPEQVKEKVDNYFARKL